jgi:hypothetical protein
MPPPSYVLAPAGTTPASTWTGDALYVSPEAPPITFSPRVDPETGERLSLFVGMDPIPCALARQFRTRRASGVAVADEGRDYQLGAKNDDQAAARISGEVRRIFEPFVARGDVLIEAISTAAGPKTGTRATVAVLFVDRTTSRGYRAVVGASTFTIGAKT